MLKLHVPNSLPLHKMIVIVIFLYFSVDASREDGSLGRLVNDDHLNPNSKMKIIRVDGRPHLCLFALKDISPGEEITYNYGDSDWPWRSKISKEIPDQPSKVAMCSSLSDSTGQMPKEILDQLSEVAMCSSLSDNTDQMPKEILVQPSEVAMCISFSDNTDQMPQEILVQPSEVAMCSSLSDNTDQMPKEILVQPSEVAMCSSLSDNTDQMPKEILVQPSEVAMCSSLSDNTDQIPKEILDQLSEMAMCSLLSDNIDQEPADVTMCCSFLDIIDKNCEHDLVPGEMSSFEKCAFCGGPFAPLRWVGERCIVCCQSWHKNCYLKHMKNITEPLSMASEEHSSSQVTSSDVEYVPDSHSNSNNSCEDRSERFKNHHNHLEVQNFEVFTSKSASKQTRHYQENLLDEEKESGPKAAELLLEDTVNTNRLQLSGVQANDGNDTDGEGKQFLNTSSSLRNKTFCYICEKPQTRFARHLKTHVKTNADVARILILPKKSKERMKMLNKLRNKGNYNHNTEVLSSGDGLLKPRRTSKKKYNPKDYVHCMYCQALYLRRDLWRHVRKCSSKPVETNSEIGRTKILSLATMFDSALCQQVSPGVWKLLTAMKNDEITATVRSDFYILQLAQSFFNKHGQKPTKYKYIRQKLREIGRLLLTLRKDFSIYTLEDAVRPANFQMVIQAVKKVSGFDEEKHCYQTPSLALKLGHSLQKISDIIHCRALMAEDSELVKSTQTFKTLYSTKWAEFVSHTALTTLNERHFNKPCTLSFTEDVQRLHKHLEKTAEEAFKNLDKTSSPQSYGELCKATMANIILFNRCRGGEVSKMKLKGFLERNTTALHEDVAVGLTKFELKLCNHFSRVEIRGKRGQKVAVLLSPDMVNALTHLINKRKDCGVPEDNPFLFGRPQCLTPYRGPDCLRLYASECGAKNPQLLRSTQLRKHVATLSQVLNLRNNELDQVADFLGHDIQVHREFYRLPEATTQLAKISKLLLAMEKGSLGNLQGKTLEEIEIEDNLVLTDVEQSEESDGEVEEENLPTDSQIASDSAGMSIIRQPVEKPPCTSLSSEDKERPRPHVEPPGMSLLPQVIDANQTDTSQAVIKNANGKAKDPRRKAKVMKQSSKCHKTVPGLSEKLSLENARRVQKRQWSPKEVEAMMRHFEEHIRKGKLATMIECEQCKTTEHPTLTDRSLQNISDFVRNRGITLKRKGLVD
ncbi:uncharacterized protein LOC129456606 [Periophthalmus magnuspinnatus]|uniref:uncharacterized protein LOC129456606 n=1 Tax=Periophthalmus magnuspinnatus TaxID=409849 RepID=UPI002436E0E6|nr:uncharacterized protein LOC129456606 [Periophthalmus magnuspinnatus]